MKISQEAFVVNIRNACGFHCEFKRDCEYGCTEGYQQQFEKKLEKQKMGHRTHKSPY